MQVEESFQLLNAGNIIKKKDNGPLVLTVYKYTEQPHTINCMNHKILEK